MKYFGSILGFTRDRNADLMRAYREQLASARIVVMPEIFKKVADSPAQRFWISIERAAIVIAAMQSGKQLPPMRPTKQEMFDEIFKRFIVLRNRYPNKTIRELASIVIHQPAPKFYLTPRTVGEIIYRIQHGWYDKQFDRDRQDIDKVIDR